MKNQVLACLFFPCPLMSSPSTVLTVWIVSPSANRLINCGHFKPYHRGVIHVLQVQYSPSCQKDIHLLRERRRITCFEECMLGRQIFSKNSASAIVVLKNKILCILFFFTAAEQRGSKDSRLIKKSRSLIADFSKIYSTLRQYNTHALLKEIISKLSHTTHYT